MKTFPFAALLAVAALALAAPSIVWAQDAEPPALVKMKEPAARQRVVKIKNLPSAVLAYTLDPQHNPRPASLGAADKSDKPETKSMFDLPGSITQIVSVDPQNVLLIKGGSDEDIRRLQELIDALDQPLRQVELEAQCVQISLEDARTFGIDLSRDKTNKTMILREEQGKERPIQIQIGFVRNNFTARVNALAADNRAKIITAPRVTALNNLSAIMEMKVKIGPLTDDNFTYTFPMVGVDLTITPTINGDDTVTLLFGAVSKDGDDSSVAAIANVRDGDTIAISGLSPLFAPAGALDPPNTLIFITPRIVRRVEDVKAKPVN